VPGSGENAVDHRAADPALRVHFLGPLPYDSFLALQRRLAYEIGGDPSLASLIVCEHPPGITVGREGSRLHVRPTPDELAAREWRLRWVARGGGVMLHLPGQVCAYPILPLQTLKKSPAEYLAELHQCVADVVRKHGLEPRIEAARPGVWVGDRRVAHVGVAVRGGVTAFGAVLNVCPDLELFDGIACDGDPRPMTSLERECPTRVRLSSVRLDLAEAVAARFGYPRQSVFHTHNILHANAHPR
jgi:lipoyl(octanoyl) transferase